MEAEGRLLRWGGLAGVLGSIVFILVFAIVIVFAGADPAEPEAEVIKFPDIRAARILENSLYLLVLVLWVVHFLALYRALRASSLAPALFGSVVGIAGLTVLAAGALPHIATAQISDLYHASGATAEDRASLVLIWQATEAIFDALFVSGLLILSVGLIGLGAAMLDAPAFGKGLGRTSMALGAAALVAASVLLVEPDSPSAFIGVLAPIVFHTILGWKVYGLSKLLSDKQSDSQPRI